MSRYSENWEFLAAKAEAMPAAPGSRQWLAEMLQMNADTEYGRIYNFAAIGGVDDFRKAIPICAYEQLAPRIKRMAAGEENILFAGRAAAFEYTGGSTSLNGSGGGARLVPYSGESLRDFRRAMLPWLGAAIREYHPAGPAYWCVSPAMRRPCATEGGIPIGLADGAYLGPDVQGAILELSAVPAWAAELEEPRIWRLATLYYLLRAHDLSFLFLWSPTFFLSLLRGLREAAGELLTLLGDGGVINGIKLCADAGAAQRLGNFLEHGDTRALWPGPMFVSAWADGWAAAFAGELRRLLPQAAFQPKGLLCTEGVVSVPYSENYALVAEGCGFLEFMDQDGTIRLADDLAPGMICRVLMTTAGGLYRYASGDMAQCQAIVGGRPALRFVGRAGICSDMTGEKLVDGFVAACLSGLRGFAMLQPADTWPPCYRLLLDSEVYGRSEAALAAKYVDKALAGNPQYAYARKTGQLGQVEAVAAPEPLDAYLAWAAANGISRQGILKIPSLCVNRTFDLRQRQRIERVDNEIVHRARPR